MKEVILKAENLCKTFSDGGVQLHILKNIDLELYRGDFTVIMGASGAGKSTLVRCINLLEKPTGGSILFNGKDIGGVAPAGYRAKVGMVFQYPEYQLFADTVIDDVCFGLKNFGVKDKEEQRKIIGDILEAVNMRREYMDRYPHEFSGGQRQRIGIARALCVNPEMVVCDEAVSALDVSIQAQVLNLLMKLKEERNLTYIFITHNLSVVEYISDRIAVMYLGKIVELADTEQIFDNTMHPYTEALLSAIPIVDPDHKHSRIVLEGDVPNPVRPPDGCLFHPRCKKCMEICKKERPKLIKHTVEGKDHFCACHLYDNGVAQKG